LFSPSAERASTIVPGDLLCHIAPNTGQFDGARFILAVKRPYWRNNNGVPVPIIPVS